MLLPKTGCVKGAASSPVRRFGARESPGPRLTSCPGSLGTVVERTERSEGPVVAAADQDLIASQQPRVRQQSTSLVLSGPQEQAAWHSPPPEHELACDRLGQAGAVPGSVPGGALNSGANSPGNRRGNTTWRGWIVGSQLPAKPRSNALEGEGQERRPCSPEVQPGLQDEQAIGPAQFSELAPSLHWIRTIPFSSSFARNSSTSARHCSGLTA